MPHSVEYRGRIHLDELLMLVFCFGCLLPLLLHMQLLLFLLLLFELPSTLQSCSGLAVTTHLLNFSKLADTLLMSCMQKLVQTPGSQCMWLSVSIAIGALHQGCDLASSKRYLVALRMLAVDCVVTPSREAPAILLETSWATVDTSELIKPCV